MNKDETTEESKLTADFLFDENQTYDNDAAMWRINVQNDKVEFLLVTTDKIFKVNKSIPVNEQLLLDKLYKEFGVSSPLNINVGSTHSVQMPVTPNQITITPTITPLKWNVMGQTFPVPNVTPRKTSLLQKISNQSKKLFMSGDKHNDIK